VTAAKNAPAIARAGTGDRTIQLPATTSDGGIPASSPGAAALQVALDAPVGQPASAWTSATTLLGEPADEVADPAVPADVRADGDPADAADFDPAGALELPTAAAAAAAPPGGAAGGVAGGLEDGGGAGGALSVYGAETSDPLITEPF
jgi:hypothetical protein